MRIRILRTLATVAALSLFCMPVLAQTTGTIRGQIRDGEGAALPGVAVTATSDSRGTERSVETGAGGSFVLSS